MDPSGGLTNLNRTCLKQKNIEEELPSHSRFFPYVEINDLSASAKADDDDSATEKLSKDHPITYKTDFSSEIFVNKVTDETKAAEDRARLLGAVRKRQRHGSRNGKEITLDMEDKGLERIIASIADVCELKVNISGAVTRTESTQEGDTSSIADFVEKDENEGVSMTKNIDEETCSIKGDEIGNETKDAAKSPRTETTESKTEQLQAKLDNINQDIEKEWREIMKIRLRKLKSMMSSDSDKDALNGPLALNPGENNARVNTVVHHSSVNPYNKLPPISDLKTGQEQRDVNTCTELSEKTKPLIKQQDIAKSPIIAHASTSTSYNTENASGKDSPTTSRPASSNRRPKEFWTVQELKQYLDSKDSDSRPPSLSPATMNKLRRRFSRKQRRQDDEPYTVNRENSWSPDAQKVEEAERDHNKYKSWAETRIPTPHPNFISISPTEYVPKSPTSYAQGSSTNYVPMSPTDAARQHRSNRRYHNVRQYAVSPTTETPYETDLWNYQENESQNETSLPVPPPSK